MGAMDLFEDGFPHGTPDGFLKGCKGAHCPAQVEGGLRCRDAYLKYQGDFRYRKVIDAGGVWTEPAAEPAVKVPAVRVVETPVAEVAPVGKPKRKPGARLEGVKHGTTTGYSYGCRCEECRDAAAEYQRARKARRQGQVTQQPAPVQAVSIPAAVEPHEDEGGTLQRLEKKVERLNRQLEQSFRWTILQESSGWTVALRRRGDGREAVAYRGLPSREACDALISDGAGS